MQTTKIVLMNPVIHISLHWLEILHGSSDVGTSEVKWDELYPNV